MLTAEKLSQAEKQKERLAQKRAAELNNTNESININEPEANPVSNDEQEEASGFVMSM